MVGRVPIPSFNSQSQNSIESGFFFLSHELKMISIFNESGFSRHYVLHGALMSGGMQILEAPGPKHLLKAY